MNTRKPTHPGEVLLEDVIKGHLEKLKGNMIK